MTVEAKQKTLLPGDEEASIDEQFADFHAANPEVYDALVGLAREARRVNGRAKIGIGMLFEVLRWHFFLHTADDSFKLNNNYRSRYARKIMEREPDLRDIFDTRGLRT
jgi:hypothetical protein